MIKFPYAIRDFYDVITEQYFYLDRTDRSPLIERAGKELLFMRPRRFGKSLLLSMLMNYYDVAKADEFELLFGDLAIGKNPTPLHNQYLVMHWDFSEVKSQGTIEEMGKSLNKQINGSLEQFIMYYKGWFDDPITLDEEDAMRSFKSVLAVMQTVPYKLYLFIDEYDNFANEVMMGDHGNNRKRYEDFVMGEGVFKTIFKNIKSAGSGAGLDRVFITGISPIVMSDVTSGSVNKDITWRPYFNDLCGFREDEVRPLTAQIIAGCGLPPEQADEAMELMRIFYDGSRFTMRDAESAAKIYNPTSTIYFLEELQEYCMYPERMLDKNLAADPKKLSYIADHPQGSQLIMDALHEETVLKVTSISDQFGMKDMLKMDKQRDHLASLLCYLGALTIRQRGRDGQWILEIPNLVMRRFYAEQILDSMLPESHTLQAGLDAARSLYSGGDIEPLCSFIEEHDLTVFSNRDYQHANELTIKTIFLALLYRDEYYIMDSEPEIQRTYGDLIMLIRTQLRYLDLYDILIEFKYLKLSEVEMTGVEVKAKSTEELKALCPVKEKFKGARTQLMNYRQRLDAKYGDLLQLRTYAVVAIGFDKLLWEEVILD